MTERCWIGSVSVSVSVSASVSASASVRWRLDGRMAFVPEGQADRSQARSAWVTMQRGPVPGMCRFYGPKGQDSIAQALAWVSRFIARG